jgi:hypothetical protein
LKALDDSMISGALSGNISFHDTLMPFYKLDSPHMSLSR